MLDDHSNGLDFLRLLTAPGLDTDPAAPDNVNSVESGQVDGPIETFGSIDLVRFAQVYLLQAHAPRFRELERLLTEEQEG
jgi:hypothetical protein